MFTSRKLRSLKNRRAFTLLEVMLSMAILLLLTGALFSLVQGSLKASALLEQKQKRWAQVSSYVQLCEEIFNHLPPQAILQSTTVQTGDTYLPVLTIRNAPGLFSWMKKRDANQGIILAARSQIGGDFNLSILSPIPPDSEMGGKIDASILEEKEGGWLSVLPNVRKVTWRFFDPRNNSWVEEWNDAASWPKAIELNILLAEQKELVRSVILLPQLSHVMPPTFEAQNVH